MALFPFSPLAQIAGSQAVKALTRLKRSQTERNRVVSDEDLLGALGELKQIPEEVAPVPPKDAEPLAPPQDTSPLGITEKSKLEQERFKERAIARGERIQAGKEEPSPVSQLGKAIVGKTESALERFAQIALKPFIAAEQLGIRLAGEEGEGAIAALATPREKITERGIKEAGVDLTELPEEQRQEFIESASQLTDEELSRLGKFRTGGEIARDIIKFAPTAALAGIPEAALATKLRSFPVISRLLQGSRTARISTSAAVESVSAIATSPVFTAASAVLGEKADPLLDAAFAGVFGLLGGGIAGIFLKGVKNAGALDSFQAWLTRQGKPLVDAVSNAPSPKLADEAFENLKVEFNNFAKENNISFDESLLKENRPVFLKEPGKGRPGIEEPAPIPERPSGTAERPVIVRRVGEKFSVLEGTGRFKKAEKDLDIFLPKGVEPPKGAKLIRENVPVEEVRRVNIESSRGAIGENPSFVDLITKEKEFNHFKVDKAQLEAPFLKPEAPTPKVPEKPSIVSPKAPSAFTRRKILEQPGKFEAPPAKKVPAVKPVVEIKTSGLAKGIEQKAVANKLTTSFEDLPEFKVVKIADQARGANKIVKENFENAKLIAMGKKLPPKGILPESVLVAVEDAAIKAGDVNTLRELATSSNLVDEATTMGQRLRLLGERNPDSAVSNIQKVAKERISAVEKKTRTTVAKAKKKTVDDIKQKIKKEAPTKDEWSSFIDSITC